MKTSLRVLFAATLVASTVVACSKKDDPTPTTTTTSAAATATTTAPTATASATAAAAPVEVSSEMKDFMGMLDGSDGGTGKALKKHAVTSMQGNDLSMYKLKNPKVTKSEKLGVMQCYMMESEAGVMKHETKVCWDSKGKIAQITDKSS